MLLLRSEEHLARWLSEHGRDRGATMSLRQQWELSRAWYGRRLEPDWRRYTVDEATSVFASCELTGPFWALA